MKKKLLFQLGIITLCTLFSACSKEELTDKILNQETFVTEDNFSPFSAGSPSTFDVLGHGYDVTGEFANASSAGYQVIDIARFKQDQPNRLIEEYPRKQESSEEYGENARKYTEFLSKRIEATANYLAFTSTLTSVFNSSTIFDAKYIYGSYGLSIIQKRLRLNAAPELLQNYLTTEFLDDLQNNTPQQIVRNYGTHVLVDISTGGKLDLMFQSETKNHNRTDAARIGIKAGVTKVFDLTINDSINITSSNDNFSRKLIYKTRGGDPTQQLIGQLNLDQSVPKISTTAWQSSSTLENSVLVDIGKYGLIPLYDLIVDATKKAAIKNHILNHIAGNDIDLIYNPVPIYAYFNQSHNDHHTTRSNTLHTFPDWQSDGIGFYAYQFQAPGTVPVYGYYASSSRDHFSSRATLDQMYLPFHWWVYEGILYYAYPGAAVNRKPVYSYVNKDKTDHYLSTDPNLAKNGKSSYWKNEGIAFYVPNL